MDDNLRNGPSRQQRRAAERAERKRLERDERAWVLRRIAGLVETDRTVSGCTLILPDGTVDYIDADLLRRGGGRA